MSEKYQLAIVSIITEQQFIIGPLAYELAKRASGVTVMDHTEIQVTGDPKVALGNLVNQFFILFGKTSIEVSKRAMKKAGSTLGPEELPDILL